MSEELKPCPFCGAHATKYDEDSWRTATKHVLCTVCPASVGPCDTYDEAIAAWNKRAQHAGEAAVWIQRNHLEAARQAPHLCRVEPTQRFTDFVPLYAAPQPAALPDGFVLVPKELSAEQLKAIYDAPDDVHGGGWERLYQNMYRIAVAASPQPRE